MKLLKIRKRYHTVRPAPPLRRFVERLRQLVSWMG